MARIYWMTFLQMCGAACRSRIASIFLSVPFAMMMYGAFQTLRTHAPPLIASGEQIAYTTKAGDMILVEYERDITIMHDFNGDVIRTIACDNGWTHDIPATTRQFKKGQYHAMRSFLVPYVMPASTRCKMDTLLVWKPTFSLSEQSFKIAPIPFVIIPNEKHAKDAMVPHTHDDGHPHKHDPGMSSHTKMKSPNTKEDMVIQKREEFRQ